MIANPVSILITPRKQWQALADHSDFGLIGALFYPIVMAALPAIAWYFGTTKIGWTVGDGEVVKLTADSARVMILLFYLVMVASVAAIGYAIHWMASTYGSETSTARGIVVAGFAATPLFIAGAIGFLPVLWVALVIAFVALAYAVYLLYLGIPIVMGIPEERGFLFASAIIAVCLVILMIIMGGTVILWDMGAAPSFTD